LVEEREQYAGRPILSVLALRQFSRVTQRMSAFAKRRLVVVESPWLS
jgi:hypothetical protein